MAYQQTANRVEIALLVVYVALTTKRKESLYLLELQTYHVDVYRT